jgi:hypothetical protein
VRWIVQCGVFLAATCLFSQVTAQTLNGRPPLRPVNTPFTTIDLVPRDAYDVLERAGQVEAICGRSPQNHPCVRKVLSSHTYVFQLHTEPTDSAPSAGVILMTVTPGEALTDIEYVAPSGADSARIVPDDGTSDWGYGSPFRLTVLERQGNWVRLPRRPFPEPVWIEAERSLGRIELSSATTGGLYTLDERNLFILSVLKNGLRVRDEQPADMPCDGDEKPVVKPFRSTELTLDQLYDSDGHFLMTVSYPRGC